MGFLRQPPPRMSLYPSLPHPPTLPFILLPAGHHPRLARRLAARHLARRRQRRPLDLPRRELAHRPLGRHDLDVRGQGRLPWRLGVRNRRAGARGGARRRGRRRDAEARTSVAVGCGGLGFGFGGLALWQQRAGVRLLCSGGCAAGWVEERGACMRGEEARSSSSFPLSLPTHAGFSTPFLSSSLPIPFSLPPPPHPILSPPPPPPSLLTGPRL